MKRLIGAALLLLASLAGVACSSNEPALPTVQVVTVVVEPTVGPTQTPLYVTEVQTVVVTVTTTPSRTVRPTRTPSATPEESAEVEEATTTPVITETSVPATATARPQPTATVRPATTLKYPAPTLDIPVNQEIFGDAQPLLRWSGQPLAENEYYEVTIERLWQNQPYYSGSEWVQGTELLVPTFVRGTSDTNQYVWWVTIKRLTGTNTAGGKVGESLSPPSEQRTFIWHPE